MFKNLFLQNIDWLIERFQDIIKHTASAIDASGYIYCCYEIENKIQYNEIKITIFKNFPKLLSVFSWILAPPWMKDSTKVLPETMWKKATLRSMLFPRFQSTCFHNTLFRKKKNNFGEDFVIIQNVFYAILQWHTGKQGPRTLDDPRRPRTLEGPGLWRILNRSWFFLRSIVLNPLP